MLRLLIAVVAVTTAVVARNAASQDYRVVMTETGLVRGAKAADGDYIAFLGIPYALPPLGVNRFKAPQPATPWEGVYEANRVVRCPQGGVGEEDCLVVNVFTPTNVPSRPLPVLFYTHGGAFIFGTGQSSGAEPLIKEDVIVVTYNYRLGALGFLCLGTEEAPGNAGLKDQIAALKWVKRNIANFGGDPEDITVYGMSAGGSSTEFMILSQQGHGLYKRAIIESGTAITVWSVNSDPLKTAMEMAEVLGFPNTTNLHELVEHYRSFPADRLSVLNNNYYNSLTDGTFGFAPCLEKEIPGVEPYITEYPYEILTNEKFHKVPVMFMFATLEGLFLRSREYHEQNYKERMRTAFHDFLPADLVFESDEEKQNIAKEIKEFYFGNRTIDDDTIMEYLDFFGDSQIMKSFMDSMLVHAKDNTVYLMEFMYKGGLGLYQEMFDFIDIAGHGDVTKHVILNLPAVGERNKLAVARVAKLIANFIKYENPTPTTSALLPVSWPKVDENTVSCLHFNDDLKIIEKPYWERKAFWDQVYDKYRKPTK